MGLDPKGHPILWKGEDLGLCGFIHMCSRARAHTHARAHAAAVRPAGRAEPGRVVVVGASASASKRYFFFDPRTFQIYK